MTGAAPLPSAGFDLAVVGAGIVGLAHALAASRLGKRIVVIDRDAQANGASIRNFGFITVTGQQAGACWRRAMRSRDIWLEVAPQARIEVVQSGLAVVARRRAAARVLEAFMATDMGRDCTFLDEAAARARFPMFVGAISGVLWSPHDRRVESRSAIPALAAWLADARDVTFVRGVEVFDVNPPHIETSAGQIEAETAIVCPGDDFTGLFAGRIASYGLSRCKLQMLRADDGPNLNLPCAVMTDLSLCRYLGYAELPESAGLKREFASEQPAHLGHGVHLIVVQSADGSLVIGDSHHYAATPDPFGSSAVDDLILDEYVAVFGRRPRITERWTGTYASASDRLMLIDAPGADTRLVMITSGTGASTAFAIAEEVVEEFYGLRVG
ncbi:MAG: TIGR03364 family FAD-dependent oxidoreductase [Methylobacteriaceae bacterium]|nr:TIGR03364 family FAD-dependent oxidoreductase [Methylobacteriaceae bacterium]MBV9637423.1 TIGR03364 family FAD-dependent oxidoreductase [Methylobacteriaceae bacterium]